MIVGHIWYTFVSHDIFTSRRHRVLCLHLSNPMHRSRFLMEMTGLARLSLRLAVD